MSMWRRMAIEKLPKQRETIEKSESLGKLWMDLWFEFREAHIDPVDVQTIRGCYEFAWWCIGESHSKSVAGDALMGFYENLLDDSVVRKRLPEFLSVDQFRVATPGLAYPVGPEKFAELSAEFVRRRKEFAQTARWERQANRHKRPCHRWFSSQMLGSTT